MRAHGNYSHAMSIYLDNPIPRQWTDRLKTQSVNHSGTGDNIPISLPQSSADRDSNRPCQLRSSSEVHILLGRYIALAKIHFALVDSAK